jgi:hypothetical protein
LYRSLGLHCIVSQDDAVAPCIPFDVFVVVDRIAGQRGGNSPTLAASAGLLAEQLSGTADAPARQLPGAMQRGGHGASESVLGQRLPRDGGVELAQVGQGKWLVETIRGVNSVLVGPPSPGHGRLHNVVVFVGHSTLSAWHLRPVADDRREGAALDPDRADQVDMGHRKDPPSIIAVKGVEDPQLPWAVSADTDLVP